MDIDEEEYQSAERRFSVSINISHPTLLPDEITTQLSLQPTYVQRVGSQRRGGRGQPLPGLYKRTSWTHSQIYAKRGHGFAEQLARLVMALVPREDFLKMVRETGGATSLAIAFLDDKYYGDAIQSQVLTRIAALGLDFGIDSYAVPQNMDGQVVKLPD